MRSGFWTGMVLGILLGATAYMMVGPEPENEAIRRARSTSRGIAGRVRRLWRGSRLMAEAVDELAR